MEKYLDKFKGTLYKFLCDLNRYHLTEGVTKILKNFDKLKIFDIAARYHDIIDKIKNDVESKNEKIFQTPLLLLPGVNISNIWNHLIKGQKQRIWMYIDMLYILGDIIIKQEHFNPYVGIGGNNENYNVNDMFSGIKNINEEDIGSTNMFGLDKMINFDELSEQLDKMDPKKIDEAAENINNMLGSGDGNNQTSNLIKGMLSEIKKEFKNTDIKNGNPVKNLMKVANSVATKMQNDVNPEQMQELMRNTQNITRNITDDNGNQIFNGNMNPMSMMTNLLRGNSNLQEQLKNMGFNFKK